MLSNEDHPGLFSFMVGMIVLVMVAVVLSLMLDGRFRFSGNKNQLESKISGDARTLEELHQQLRVQSCKLASLETNRTEPQRYDAKVKGLAELEKELARLSSLREELTQELVTMNKDYSRCRADYRLREWAAAVGQKIPLLKIRGGREYRDASILRVTEVGLEVKHADGLARIDARDLDEEWQDRLQWNAEERRETLEQEHRDRASVHQESKKPTAAIVSQQANLSVEDIQALRSAVVNWCAKAELLRRELQTANDNERHGRNRSLPGSLETWEARIKRLSAELDATLIFHEQAKARLRASGTPCP